MALALTMRQIRCSVTVALPDNGGDDGGYNDDDDGYVWCVCVYIYIYIYIYMH